MVFNLSFVVYFNGLDIVILYLYLSIYWWSFIMIFNMYILCLFIGHKLCATLVLLNKDLNNKVFQCKLEVISLKLKMDQEHSL